MLSKPEDFEIWPENREAVEIFLALETQWKVTAFGGFLGLDYSGVEVVFRMREVSNKSEIFAMIQVMECAALPVLNKKKD